MTPRHFDTLEDSGYRSEFREVSRGRFQHTIIKPNGDRYPQVDMILTDEEFDQLSGKVFVGQPRRREP